MKRAERIHQSIKIVATHGDRDVSVLRHDAAAVNYHGKSPNQ
jgi:hypothetical protein